MTEVVWVALISAGGAVIAALATQILIARAAAQGAGRLVDKEARDWQRSEMRRREELHDERLREFWAQVLLAQTRMINSVLQMRSGKAPMTAFESSAPAAAAEAYSIALLGLVTVRAHAKNFYNATADVHNKMDELHLSTQKGRAEELDSPMTAWRKSFDALELVMHQEYLNHTTPLSHGGAIDVATQTTKRFS